MQQQGEGRDDGRGWQLLTAQYGSPDWTAQCLCVLALVHVPVCRGGAVKMHNPSCSSLSWSGGVFSGNSAGDGGALYLTEITTRTINGSATYTHNTVSGGQGRWQRCRLASTTGCCESAMHPAPDEPQ